MITLSPLAPDPPSFESLQPWAHRDSCSGEKAEKPATEFGLCLDQELPNEMWLTQNRGGKNTDLGSSDYGV